jgi:hypothetical protein
MTDAHSTKNRMTLEAIHEDKWTSVQLPLPQDSSRDLLTVALAAARECADDARQIVRTHDREDADSVGYAMEMRFMEGQAYDRIDLIKSRLEGSPAPPRGRTRDPGGFNI